MLGHNSPSLFLTGACGKDSSGSENKDYTSGGDDLPTDVQHELMIPPPPIFFDPLEFCWLDATNPSFHKVTIDKNVGLEEQTEAKQLFNVALNETLSISQRQTLQNELNSDPKFVQTLGFKPNKLPDLVENNPLIAVDVLVKLSKLIDISDFCTALVNMEMSVHSMEVINRLSSCVDLPKEFFHVYITNIIKTCEGYTDKYMQNRLVRLACVFIQAVIRNRVVDIEDLYVEVMTFCLEFSRIREAAALYRLIKQVESEDTTLQRKLESQQNPSLQLAEANFIKAHGCHPKDHFFK